MLNNTVSNTVIGFANHKRKLNRREKTIMEYVSSIDKFVTWGKCVDLLGLKSVTQKDSQQWIFDMRNKLSQSTVRKHLAGLIQFYNFLMIEYNFVINPFKFIQIPKDEITIPKNYMVQSQGDLMFDNCHSNRDKLMIGNMLYLGMRIGEVALLEAKNIDIDNKTVTFVRKNQRVATLPIRNKLLELYKERLVYCSFTKDKYLFETRTTKKPITTTGVRKIFDSLKKELKYSNDYTPHQLRKLFATDMYYDKGMRIDEVKKLLDHSSVSVTERYLIGTEKSRTFSKLAEI